jgi:hypothetical protein
VRPELPTPPPAIKILSVRSPMYLLSTSASAVSVVFLSSSVSDNRLSPKITETLNPLGTASGAFFVRRGLKPRVGSAPLCVHR